MKRSLALLVILIAVNLCGFIAMYYVYFPWMEKIDNQEKQESILSDIRFLNFRLSLLDYSYSPQTIAKAEHELNAKITATTREQLGMEPANFQALKDNRYGINMARPEGPLAYLLLNDDQTILAVGPYPKNDDSINLRDWLFYLIILLIFNAIAVLIVYRHVNEYLNVAIRAIRELDLTGLRLKPIKSPLTNIAVNTPRVVNHINGLSKQHQQSLYNQRDLMHAVAHEFRGPMARLSFALDLFAQTDSESRQKELTNDMDEALQELDDLVKEVLGYSRLKDGRFPLSLEHFDLKKVCAQTIEKVKTIYPEKQFVLYSDPPKSIPLYADCNLIERVMINLIRNAARFSNKRVKIALVPFKNSIEIRVEDDGPGIPPGKRTRIFEPFTRLDFSRNRDSGGAGLGLAIAKGIVNRHQGTIWAEDSRELGGAVFTIHMPLKQKSPIIEAEDALKGSSKKKKKLKKSSAFDKFRKKRRSQD
ncbi:sensor histidine kinase [Kangiella geojedonensis]|uniref:histidine kinase n=1 Tax=Kangiella geojedonensis TaxID=914150 RepID=A0A0F6RCA0_9GAMM|nr:ATP-binding protein [Kangiella geojedonensis]AKE52258.1 Histidine kinase [Kangiella geojedonensis]